MSSSSTGELFVVTNFGESHGPAIGCVIDGCPPAMELTAEDIQKELDRRKPGQSRHVTQRKESDTVEILSGVYEGKTTGTPIALLIRNEDQRSRDYGDIAHQFRLLIGLAQIALEGAVHIECIVKGKDGADGEKHRQAPFEIVAFLLLHGWTPSAEVGTHNIP